MKIAVVGSINMDMVVEAERIPMKGETLRGENLQYVPGGKGANQAVAMSKLGATVEMFGCVGNDGAGTTLLANLDNMGVITKNIKVIEGVPTGIALITVGDHDNTIIIVAGANGCVDKSYVESISDELATYDVVVLQHEIPEETVEYVVNFCVDHGIKVVLNPAPARPVSPEVLEKITYLTPNEHEAVILFGDEISTEDLLMKYPEKLVITQGSLGVSVGLEAGEAVLVPARKANVVDTTGAGDTLNGAFTVRIAEGASIVEALRFGNVAASLSTEKFGAQGGMPTREEVEEALLLY